MRKYLSDADAAPTEESDNRNVTETTRDKSMSREVKVVETPANAENPPKCSPTYMYIPDFDDIECIQVFLHTD